MEKNVKSKTSSDLKILAIISVALLVIAGIIIAFGKNSKSSAATSERLEYYHSYMELGGPDILGDQQSNPDEATSKMLAEMEANAVDLDSTDLVFRNIVQEVKEEVRKNFCTHDYLRWDRFDSVTVKYVDKTFELIKAMYDDQSNTLYITKACEPGLDLNETLAHELIHALTTNDVCKNSVYYEGATEYFAQMVYRTGGASYLHAYAFAEVYTRRYGLERALKDFSDLSALDDIDERLCIPGIANNIESLISYVDHGRFETFPQAVVADVYLNYAKESKVPASEIEWSTDWILKFVEACPDSENAMNYLKSIRGE